MSKRKPLPPHTPLPWTMKRTGLLSFEVQCKSNVPGHPGTVATAGYRPNAAFIVRACNGYEDAIGLLRACVSALEGHPYSPPAATVKAAKAAIAKAMGPLEDK